MSALTEETFTFQGDLPKNFGLRAQAHYYPVDKGCSVSRRALLREFETEPMFENKERHYQFEIPVSYRAGTCAVKLRRVGLYIYGRYGEQDWQKTYELGGLYAVDQLPEGSPSFDGAGVMRKQAQCEWLFQLSKARSRRNSIEKMLVCKNAGAYLPINGLVGKAVVIDFLISEVEKPGWNRRWIKTKAGWKPCQGTAQSERCQVESTFKTFKLNGRECTVYPNCTE